MKERDMRALRNTGAALALAVGLSACASSGSSSPGVDGGNLSRWIETDGAAYIAEQLSTDPRFADSRVQLVQLDGDQITADVNRLSDELRRQLISAVLREKNVSLTVRPTVVPWRTQRSLAQVDCRILNPVTHIVGLDIRSNLTGGYQLSIRSRDMRDNNWTSGFEKSWAGELNNLQQAALNEPVMDISLRGLRSLPFEWDQPDLTASYLAQNLSCLLRQGPSNRLKVFIEPLPFGTFDYFGKVTTLISRYMNQYQEVDVVSDRAQANAVVNSEVVNLASDLWQMWVGVAFTDSGLQVSGADTPAYVKLDPTSQYGGKVRIQ